jgi:hypothetical protein
VRDLDQADMKSVSLGLQNLSKLNEIASSMCIGFCNVYGIWLWYDF